MHTTMSARDWKSALQPGRDEKKLGLHDDDRVETIMLDWTSWRRPPSLAVMLTESGIKSVSAFLVWTLEALSCPVDSVACLAGNRNTTNAHQGED